VKFDLVADAVSGFDEHHSAAPVGAIPARSAKQEVELEGARVV
jgi:hypothetical protein